LWTCHHKFGAYPWRYEKVVGYMKNQFFGRFSERMFQKRTRLRFDTFHVLIKVVGSSLEQKKKHEKKQLYGN